MHTSTTETAKSIKLGYLLQRELLTIYFKLRSKNNVAIIVKKKIHYVQLSEKKSSGL